MKPSQKLYKLASLLKLSAQAPIWIDPRPSKAIPPHFLGDRKFGEWLSEEMRKKGWIGRPLLGLKVGGKIQLLTGSHRFWAARQAGIKVPVILLSGPAAEKFRQSKFWEEAWDLPTDSNWFALYQNAKEIFPGPEFREYRELLEKDYTTYHSKEDIE